MKKLAECTLHSGYKNIMNIKIAVLDIRANVLKPNMKCYTAD